MNTTLDGTVKDNTNPSETVDPANMLQRAKDQGLKVTADGRIVLPGDMPTKKVAKPKAEKIIKTIKPKAVKEPKPVKEFKGINSKIFSTGDVIGKIVDGLSLIKDTLIKENITSPYKISTYKTELRIAFDTIKGAELIGKMTLENAQKLNEIGFTAPDKKDFLSINIA